MVNEKEPGLMWFYSLVLSACFTSQAMKGKQPQRKKKIKIFKVNEMQNFKYKSIFVNVIHVWP